MPGPLRKVWRGHNEERPARFSGKTRAGDAELDKAIRDAKMAMPRVVQKLLGWVDNEELPLTARLPVCKFVYEIASAQLESPVDSGDEEPSGEASAKLLSLSKETANELLRIERIERQRGGGRREDEE